MKKYLIPFAVLVIGGVAYYGISPLFRTSIVNEEIPVAQNVAPVTPVSKIPASPVSGDMTSTASPVSGTPAHPASGTARVVSVDGKNYLRYENFKTINGPDLYVYLSKDPGGKDFISLGKLKATEGNINYEIPENTDPREYPYALTWCKNFSVLFNSAKLY